MEKLAARETVEDAADTGVLEEERTAGHARWKLSKSSRPSTPATVLQPTTPAHLPSPPLTTSDPPLDFASLTTIHSLYLSTLYSGLLLDSEELRGQIKEMLSTCNEFAARLERWGGDVLPGLLDNASDERNAQSKPALIQSL